MRNYVLAKILPSAETLEARGANDEATVLVLALNCKVEKRRALLFALIDAGISTFKLNANDVALSLGKRHVRQDMHELINQPPGHMLSEEGSNTTLINTRTRMTKSLETNGITYRERMRTLGIILRSIAPKITTTLPIPTISTRMVLTKWVRFLVCKALLEEMI